MYDKLSKLSGPTFDREFAKEMVQDHKQEYSQVPAGIEKADDPVGDFANQTLPILQKHLQQAEALTNNKSTSRSTNLPRAAQYRWPR